MSIEIGEIACIGMAIIAVFAVLFILWCCVVAGSRSDSRIGRG